jgi:hypothetical protein
MEAAVECTHCHVVMTSWSADGSPIRYYQCPFCQRTHSSLYGEVFRSRAGARVRPTPAAPSTPSEIPTASAEDVQWASLKATASRWFERLASEEARHATPVPVTSLRARQVGAREAAAADAAAAVALRPGSKRR